MARMTSLKNRLLASSMVIAMLVPATGFAAESSDLVPLRSVAEAAGATVHWNAQAGTVQVILGSASLTLTVGSEWADLNGQQVPVGRIVEVKDGRTLVPASFLSDLLTVKEGAPVQAVWSDSYRMLVGQLMGGSNCPGLSVGVSQNGEPVFLEGFGARNCEEGLEMTTSTLMGLGSISKTFTAVAIMQLQDAGKLSVTDLVQQHIPEYNTNRPDWAAETTIHHLLTHTAGLPQMMYAWLAQAPSLANDPMAPPQLKGLPAMTEVDQMLAAIAQDPTPQVAAPGTWVSYSNEGYTILGEIVARVSGMTWEEYLTKHILAPAGMTSTVFTVQQMQQYPEYTRLYTPVPMPDGAVTMLGDDYWWEMGFMSPAGGIISTAEDMLRFAEIFRNQGQVGEQQLLSPEAVKAMTTGHFPADYGVSYGYGLMVWENAQGMKLVGHGGANKGIQTYFAVAPQQGLASVALSNMSGGPSDLSAKIALDLAAGAPPALPALPVPLAEATTELARYEGTFFGGEAAPMSFRADGDTLIFSQAGVELPTVRIAENRFALALGASTLYFTFLGNANEVTALQVGFRVLLKQ